MLYEDLFRRLEEEQVRYVVAGGVAMVLHGVIRFTADLDLIVELSEENLVRFLSCMKGLGFRPKLPVQAEAILDAQKREQWLHEKNMRAFTFLHPRRPLSEIDILMEELIPFPELEAQAAIMHSSGVVIPVVSRKHLKLLKRMSGRDQDIADIEALEHIERLESADDTGP